jgi:hypothetical protein
MRRFGDLSLVFVLAAAVHQAQSQALPSAKPDLAPRETSQPFTVESERTYTQVNKDGTSQAEPVSKAVLQSDSQGRRRSTLINLQDGSIVSRVNDPVSGMRMVWTSAQPEVFVLRNVTPAHGRKSCWKVDPGAVPVSVEVQFGVSSFFQCLPAGFPQSGACAAPSLAQQTRLHPLQEPADETACEQDLRTMNFGEKGDGKIDDLGERVMVGVPVHGCRMTYSADPAGKMQEVWVARVGTAPLQPVIRWLWELTLPSEVRVRNETNVTKLNLDEPDLSTFQPPNGYQVTPLEVQEAPCDGKSASTSSTH